MSLTPFSRRLVKSLLTLALVAVPALAQGQTTPPCPAPAKQPPPNSPPLFRNCANVVWHPVNQTSIPGETYQYYIQTPTSLPSQDKWVPFDEALLLADFDRLWKTGFLEDLWIEVVDEPFENGVMGKHVIYHMEERARLKVIDYEGSRKVEVSKIEEALKERNISLRFDTFIDQAIIRRVQGVIRELYAEQGYQAATITPVIKELPGGPKLVSLTFNIVQGPEVKIREIVIDGNSAFSDGKLVGQMKTNKPHSWLSFITDAGTYQEALFEEDAQMIREFYQNQGYVRAQVGNPQIETIEDTKDGKTRWIRVRIPVDEGGKFRLGTMNVAGNKSLKSEGVLSFFKLDPGETVSRKKLIKGVESTQEIYSSIGHFQANVYPQFCFANTNCETGEPLAAGTTPARPADIVDVTIQVEEGELFYVNRIAFTGNTTTHDAVIRREMRVYEGGIFNAESLKESVKRLNQLGYFKPLEKAEDFAVEPTKGATNKVDIRLKFEEQNRNQLSFGAGVSQFDGFFGQLSFQTSNFLGRGETVAVSLQKGSQARNYQLSFSEPYLFDRPITAGIDVYARQYIYPLQFTQDETGTNTIVGVPLSGYSRAYLGYSYAQIRVQDINPAYLDPAVLAASPYLLESLLITEGGRRTVSKVSPSFLYNTVNQPIFPTEGKRLSVGFEVAGLGGNTSYWTTSVEGIYYKRLTNRMSLGVRGQAQYAQPYGDTQFLPIFEKFFLGGEYSLRGFDIRTVGPRDQSSGIVVGGNKSLLMNAEYYINVFGPVRFLFFYDAGQVRDTGQRFQMWDPITEIVFPEGPLLTDPFRPIDLTPIGAPGPTIREIGRTSAFRTSTGVELRFFMPVLNVPFRLIGAYNPQRFGIFNNNGVLTPRFTFKFAVGTTF